jgi:uncharacterized protein YaiI (UPF0178 family)
MSDPSARERSTDPFDGVARVYIDAMNVIGSRPDGWWRDRDAAVRRLASRLQALAGDLDAEVVLVADGRPVTGLPEGRNAAITVRYARRDGRDAADDRILELLAEPVPIRSAVTATGDASSLVVTADRELRDRAVTLGARTLGPRLLLEELDRRATRRR